MIKKITILSLGCLFLATSLFGQSWKKLSKQADKLYEAGSYMEAAKLYEQAWQKKNKKKELIYKAGNAYQLLRDYPNAAKAFANVKDDVDDFPFAGLHYARNLKQDQNYEQAIREFRSYLDKYTGESRSVLENIIRTEIEGAEFGKVAASQRDMEAEVAPVSGGINTGENEFAASKDMEGSMFYSSTTGGTARIFQSEIIESSWAKGDQPANFPIITNGQYANASLSPDGYRMYFTICENGPFSDLSTRCEIYFSEKTGAVWSQPVRLPDDINMAGVTNTHPYVAHQNNIEFLYFASNRRLGNAENGMDIWYATRDKNNPNSQFSIPTNLGPTVNTTGDEISPAYDVSSGKLYFASNNHPSLGGFDIFVSEGAMVTWSQPQNLGLPYNSSADDYHYRPFDGGAFLSSNRVVPGEKLSTKDDDIFEVKGLNQTAQLYSSTVLDASNGEPVNYYSVTLYELDPNDPNRRIQVEVKSVAQGRDGFTFEVLPQREFVIEVDAPGFLVANQPFNTFSDIRNIYADPIMVEPANAQPPVDNDPIEDPGQDGNTNTDPGNTMPDEDLPPPPQPGVEYTSRGTAPFDQAEFRTNAPQYDGVYYKVQLAAVGKFNELEARFQRLVDLGDYETEFLVDKGLYRVLIAAFINPEEAKQARATARQSGFPNAFIVKYENGQRYGMVKLR